MEKNKKRSLIIWLCLALAVIISGICLSGPKKIEWGEVRQLIIEDKVGAVIQCGWSDDLNRYGYKYDVYLMNAQRYNSKLSFLVAIKEEGIDPDYYFTTNSSGDFSAKWGGVKNLRSRPEFSVNHTYYSSRGELLIFVILGLILVPLFYFGFRHQLGMQNDDHSLGFFLFAIIIAAIFIGAIWLMIQNVVAFLLIAIALWCLYVIISGTMGFFS